MKIVNSVFLLLFLFLSGCAELTESEIQERLVNFELPSKRTDQVAVFLISPHGYHEPWTHFNIEVSGVEQALHFGDFFYLVFEKRESINLRYQYDDVFVRKDNPIEYPWTDVTFFDFDNENNMFLIVDSGEIIRASKEEALREIVIIEGTNEKRNQRRKEWKQKHGDK